MKFKEFMKNFFLGVKTGVSRFSVAFICTILAFFTVTFEIIFESGKEEIIIPLCMTFALTAVFSVLLKIIQEYITEKLNSIIQYIVSAVVTVVGFILLKTNYESLYMIMAYTGIMIALVCFMFAILMRGDNRDLVFPRLVSSMVFTGAVCGVLAGGLSTCIMAFETLLLHFDDSYKVLLTVLALLWIVFYINIFLSFIPKKEEEIPQSKIFRSLVLFAGLPLYILLVVILLAYLAKIVVTFNMPVGEINWFASFASLFFIFFLLSVRQYSEKLARFFVKYGGYFLFPVLIIQAIAVYERINAYGLTTPRTVSLVLILISILFILGSLITPKHFNKIALLSGIIVLVVTVTPFNVIDMPVKSQTKILEDVLIKNGMIENGVVIPKKDLSQDDAERISSAYHYLKYDADQVPEFIPDPDKDFEEIFGVNIYDFQNESREHYYFRSKDSVDISEYDTMIRVDYYYDEASLLEITHNNQLYSIDVKPIAFDLYSQYGEAPEDLGIVVVDDNIALYLVDFGLYLENEEIDYCNFNGYVLLKD